MFLFANSQGRVVSASGFDAGIGSGTSPIAILYCSSFPAGTYKASWRVYRQSDSLLSNPVAWSKSNEILEIVC